CVMSFFLLEKLFTSLVISAILFCMNFLAHAVFADGPEDVLFGSITADRFKGIDKSKLPVGVQDGIRVHMELDRFFDSYKPLGSSRSRLHDLVRHYANGVFDVCCDHILSRRWNDLFINGIDVFVEDVYKIAKDRQSLLPESQRAVIEKMIEGDWLRNYSQAAGLEVALQRIAYRGSHGGIVAERIPDILKVIPEIESTVLTAFPAIREHMDGVMRSFAYEPGARLHWRESYTSHPELQRRTGSER
ncbi:MAG: ACP phosphodiesterase, partial [Candidatus Paceibacterota bacterium]